MRIFGFSSYAYRVNGKNALTEKLQNPEMTLEKILDESDLSQDLPLVPAQALTL